MTGRIFTIALAVGVHPGAADPYLWVSHHERHLKHSLSQVLQRSSGPEGIDDDARRQSLRVFQSKCAWRSSFRKKALSFAQQDRIDQENHLIRQPMLEQRRSQRRAAREDQIVAVLCLNFANALHEVRSNALERAPY